MAGRPKMTQDLARLDGDAELGEVVLDAVASAMPMANICKATGLSKNAIIRWLESTPERAEAFARARAAAAHIYATDVVDIADEADEENPIAIQKAKLRINSRQWLAERWNRKDYGQAKAEVAISITGLHFEALRARTVADDVVDVTPKAIEPPTDEELASL